MLHANIGPGFIHSNRNQNNKQPTNQPTKQPANQPNPTRPDRTPTPPRLRQDRRPLPTATTPTPRPASPVGAAFPYVPFYNTPDPQALTTTRPGTGEPLVRPGPAGGQRPSVGRQVELPTLALLVTKHRRASRARYAQPRHRLANLARSTYPRLWVPERTCQTSAWAARTR